MGPRNALRALAATALLSVSCVVDEASELGRECPCTEPAFVCCAGQCVEAGAPCDVDTCPGAIKISAFEVRWSTPNGIAFQWVVDEGSMETFSRYELVLGADEEAVRNRVDVEVYDEIRNPELSFFLGPREMMVQEVTYTIADGLEPASPEQPGFFAELTAFDNAGMTCRVTLDRVNTARAGLSAMDIYTDAMNSVGRGDPSCYSESSVPPHGEGDSHRRYDVVCGATSDDTIGGVCPPDENTSDTCGVLVKMLDLGVPILLVPGDFASAYLEFQVRVPSVITYYGFVQLHIVSEALNRSYGFEPFVIRGGADFQTVQIPLSHFAPLDDSAEPLTADLFQGAITQFNWGSSELPTGTEIHTDGVRIRWQ